VLRAMKRTDAAVIADDGEQPTGTTTEVSQTGHLTLVPGQAVRALRTGRFQSHQEATSASQEEPLSSSTSATVLPAADAAHVPPTDSNSGPEGGGIVDDASVNGDQAPASDRSYWRSVAKVGVQVGDALHYAHGQGTLHRDIKPANLILDAYGVVWVTDFGLAKAVEHAHLTHSGDVVGTLQYMAPEQFHGKFDVRTDIYCLGLTLYEMLTLRPAYADASRSGLVHKVAHGTPTPPRKLRPNIPDDLEVIVLKAISKEPGHRYQTAAEFKEDLQNFLEDRPINARRTTALEHAWRWCRRNRAVASLSVVALLLLIAATVVGYVGWMHTNIAYRKESESAQRAEDNLKLSLKAFADIFDDIAGGDLLRPVTEDPGSDELEGLGGETTTEEASQSQIARTVVSAQDAALLQKILRFYDKFAEANAGNENLQKETAKAHYRIGEIHFRLRQYDQAEAAYQRSLKMYQSLGKNRDEIAAIYNGLGSTIRWSRGSWRAATQQYLKVLELMGADPECKVGVTPDTIRGQYELARAYRYLARGTDPGWFRGRRGRRGDRPPRQGTTRARRSVDRRPGSQPSRGSAEDRRRRMLEMARTSRRRQERSLELIEGLLQQQPDNPAFRLAKALSCRSLARFAPDKPATTVRPWQQEAIGILESLTRDYPTAGQFRYELALTHAMRLPWRQAQPPEDRAELLRKATVVGEALVQEFPNVDTYSVSLASHYMDLGWLLRRMENTTDTTEAENCYRRATELLRKATAAGEALVQESPTVDSYKISLAFHYMSLARLLRRAENTTDTSEVENCYRRTVELNKKLAKAPGAPLRWQIEAASIQRRLGDVLIANGKFQAARSELEASLATLQKIRQLEGPEHRWPRASAGYAVGRVHRSMADVLRKLKEDELADEHQKKADEAPRRWGRTRGQGRGRDGDRRNR
ncbi:MAG: protein kinase domain-containing protein, partial [Planctomycetota bacterium]|jgi:tetratricopeptide (TPR) repeat protein